MTFLRLYLITSLSFWKDIVIRRILIGGAGLPIQQAHIFMYNNRYHKNKIINKDFLPLVGIVGFSLPELVIFIAGTM